MNRGPEITWGPDNGFDVPQRPVRYVHADGELRIRHWGPVLDARAAHPSATLAVLYDTLAMPADLLRARNT